MPCIVYIAILFGFLKRSVREEGSHVVLDNHLFIVSPLLLFVFTFYQYGNFATPLNRKRSVYHPFIHQYNLSMHTKKQKKRRKKMSDLFRW